MSIKLPKKEQSDYSYNDKLLNENTPFGINEAFKTLRTNLFYTSKNEKCPVFGTTSAFAHAGKSIIIANTAVSYAQLNRRVLLIDADMRCPVINKIFGINCKTGLSELLAGKSESYKDFIVESQTDNLDILTSGRIPPNPSELLASDRMKDFIAEAKNDYDFIFIDLPPINEVSDAGVLAESITGYLFTIRSAATDSRAVTSALEVLSQMNAHIAGFVLNDVNPKLSSAYGGKYYKHGKYGKYEYARTYEKASKNDSENKASASVK